MSSEERLFSLDHGLTRYCWLYNLKRCLWKSSRFTDLPLFFFGLHNFIFWIQSSLFFFCLFSLLSVSSSPTLAPGSRASEWLRPSALCAFGMGVTLPRFSLPPSTNHCLKASPIWLLWINTWLLMDRVWPFYCFGLFWPLRPYKSRMGSLLIQESESCLVCVGKGERGSDRRPCSKVSHITAGATGMIMDAITQLSD